MEARETGMLRPMDSSEAWKSFVADPSDETFRPLYEGTKRLAWTLCVRILSNEADALDAFQGAYARLLSLARAGGAGVEAQDPTQLVARSAIKEADRLRKSRARRRAKESQLGDDDVMNRNQMRPEVDAERRDTNARVEQLVRELPERYRLPVQLHFFHGLSQREVAQTLEEPLTTVADRIQSGLKKLDSAFRRAGLGPARGAMAGLAIAGALLEPKLSAAAAFQGAQALAASLSASGLQASSAFSTMALLGGLGIMKVKAAFLAAAMFAFLVGGFLTFRQLAPRTAPAPPAPLARTGVVTPGPKSPPSVLVVERGAEPSRTAPNVDESAPPSGDAIVGVITDVVTREPIAGAVVRIGTSSRREVIADNEGRYRFERPGAGQHEILAMAEGHARALATVQHVPPAVSQQDLALDPALRVKVQVVDVDGRPIVKASVTPPYAGTGGAYSDETRVLTDREGIAWLESVSRLRTPDVMVEKEGYQRTYFQPRPAEGKDVVELKVVLERASMRRRVITGHVTDSAGRPIAGATIEWKDGESTSFGDGAVYGQWKAQTGFDGSYRLEYDDDYETCELGVSAKRWGPQVAAGVRAGTPDEPGVKDFRLEPSHWVAGSVVDENGKPLPLVEIHAMPWLGLLHAAVAYPSVIRKTQTDEEGRFRLEEVSGPRAALHLRARDGRPSLETELDVDRELEITLPGFAVLLGVVLDAETGAPVPSFNIKIAGMGLPMSRASTGDSFTASDGTFELKQLEPSAILDLFVEAEGYVTGRLERIVLKDIARERIKVVLSRGQLLDGVVVDASTGAPLGGVHVLSGPEESLIQIHAWDWKWSEQILGKLRIQKTTSAADGGFSFREAEPATLFLRAAGRERVFVRPADRHRFTTRDGRLRIPVARGARLSGVCYDRGAPARRVEVQLERAGEEWSAKQVDERSHGSATTDSDGRFAWDDLSPGPHLLWVSRKIGGPDPRFEVRIRRAVEVAPAGETNVDIGKDAGAHRIQGRIGGMGDRESLRIMVTLRPLFDEGGEELWLQTYKDWKWLYVCPYLRTGRYAVQASVWESHGTRTVDLEPIDVSGDRELTLEVPAATPRTE